MLVESSRLSTILNLNDSYHNPTSKRPPQQKASQMSVTKTELKPNKKGQLQRDLNDWEYCKPDNLEDKLPQPFRFINKILYKDILLKHVFMRIDEIEKAKQHHNYEGGVREVNPVSFFEISGTSCLFYPKLNPMNILLTGDKYGSFNILDLNRRIQILKKEIVPAKRVAAIDAVVIEYCEDYLITAAIITRGEPVIQIIRIWTHDYKPALLARIKTTRTVSHPFNAQTKLDEFPYKVKFSDDGLFLAVTLFNGSVELYQIPEPPLILPIVSEPDPNASSSQFKTGSTLTPNFMNPTATSIRVIDKPGHTNPKQVSVQPNLTEIPTKDLVPFKRISLRTPRKKIDPAQILTQALLGPSQEEIQAQLAKDDKGKKGAKKETKKEDPKAQQPQEEEKPFQLPPPEFEVNPELLMGKYVQDSNADISDDHAAPLYYSDLYFTYKTVSFQPDSQKTLTREVTTTITTGLVCAWRETCHLDIFDLQESLIENAPTYFSFKNKYYIQNQLNKRQKPLVEESKSNPAPSKVLEIKKEEKKEATKPGQQKEPVFQVESPGDILQPSKTCQVLYPIKAAAISKTNSFVGLGLADGSVVILDLIEYRERYQLDKHTKAVTTLSFLDDWNLVSGSVDGGLNLHRFSMNSEEEVECKKYQHIFKVFGNSITKVDISELGIAFVMDNQGNFRGYDIHHFEKIMKLNTQGSYSRPSKFSIWPCPLVSAGREQLVAVCDVIEKGSDENSQEDPTKTWNKTTVILIYRIFESLAILLPGVGSLLKKGFDRTKVMNAFAKISLKDLKNPDYDIPHFKTEDFSASKTGMRRSIGQGSDRNKLKESKSNISVSSSSDTKRKKTLSKDQKGATQGGPGHRLTQEALHPEQYILQKKNEPGPVIADSLKSTLTGARVQVSEKALRVERLQQYFTQINEDLDKKDQEEMLKKRQEQLMKESKKKK